MITYQQIATETEQKPGWTIDPKRAQKAVQMLANHPGTKVMPAKMNETGQPANGDNIWIVRASSGTGWYYVRPDLHTCTCRDYTMRGAVCKHRIAVYLYTQQQQRTAAAVRGKVKEQKLLQDIGF